MKIQNESINFVQPKSRKSMKTKYILFTIILSFVLSLKGWGQVSIESKLGGTQSPFSVVYGNTLSDDLILTALYAGAVTITYPDNTREELTGVSKGQTLITSTHIKLGGNGYSVAGKTNNGSSISFNFGITLSPRLIKVNPTAPGFTIEKEYDGNTDVVLSYDKITEDGKKYKKVNFSYCTDVNGTIDANKTAVVNGDEVYIEVKSVKYKDKNVGFNTDGTISSEKEVDVEYGDLLVIGTVPNNYGCLDVNKTVTYKVGKITQKKVSPILANYEKEKVYNNDATVKGAENTNYVDLSGLVGGENIRPVASYQYSDANVLRDANGNVENNPITISVRLENTVDEKNYLLSYETTDPDLQVTGNGTSELTIVDNGGKINPIQESVTWTDKITNAKITQSGNSPYELSAYGMTIESALGATIVSNNNFDNDYTYSYTCNGNSVDITNKVLEVGSYTLNVVCTPTNRNFETIESELNFRVPNVLNMWYPSGNSGMYGDVVIGVDGGIKCKPRIDISGTNADLEYTYYIKKDGETEYKKIAINGEDNIPYVGNYSLKCEVVDKKNFFTSIDVTPLEVPLSVTPRNITIEEPVIKESKPYDGTSDVIIEEGVSFNGILPKDESKISISTYGNYYQNDREVSDAGSSYVMLIKAECTADDELMANYQIVTDKAIFENGVKYYDGIITKCPVKVKFQDYVKEYGESVVNKDICATLEPVIIQNTEYQLENYVFSYRTNDPSVWWQGNEMIGVGEYDIKVEVEFTGAEAKNFAQAQGNLAETQHHVKVTPKTLTLSDLVIADKVYDGTTTILKEQIADPILSGVLEGETVVLSRTSTPEYPSAEAQLYKNIPVGYKITGSNVNNYQLDENGAKSITLYADSKITIFEFKYNIQPDEQGVYQLVYGNSVLGEDIQVINPLDKNQAIEYWISDINKTGDMLTPSTDPRLVTVRLTQFGILVKSEEIKIYVDKLKLIPSEPEISHVKYYDGTSSVKLTGSNSTFINRVGDDDVFVRTQTQTYDSPDIASGKTITVVFETYGGDWQSKYYPPDNIVYTDGVITTPDIDFISLGVTANGYCENELVTVTFDVISGMPLTYSILFPEQAKDIGFTDIVEEKLPDVFGPMSVQFPVPEGVSANEFECEITLYDAYGKSKSGKFKFVLNYSGSVMLSKFNDVVAINNYEGQFYNYQWYKNGEILEGETKQFFNDLPCLYGSYSAEITMIDGKKVWVCPVFYDKRSEISKSKATSIVNVYPNPARVMEPVTVELVGVPNLEALKPVIYVYNSLGTLVDKITNAIDINYLNLPKGNYTGVVFLGNVRLTFKLIVRN